ncbi:HAD-IIB family hydrolase [Candidatus Azambacteria bacterium]|nr:HAD-IIB family hydrolase [Candidatus Azambacteria bacterium]MBI3685205.1 HAD-IIB family hydrolase [Candidatus Azambacteria bacterium]
MSTDIKKAKLVIFDLDGTLTESKTDMDSEMASLLERLLSKRMVAVISGGGFDRFKEQFLNRIDYPPERLSRLFLFPTSATRFYRYDNGWKEVYADMLASAERKKIKTAFDCAFKDIHYQHPLKLYGEVVEDRGTQVTFSALGQEAPLEAKKRWRGSQDDRRREIVEALKKYLPEFQIQIPGLTSIDVTKKGINKAYGIRQMEKLLSISVSDMIFVGDALYGGGNDYPVKEAGVETIAVSGPKETKEIIASWLKTI